MKHSKEELMIWQSYSLPVKEKLTRNRIRELADTHDFYVSFSGGKDSQVAVDFTAKTLKTLGYERMHVLNIRTGLEYLSVQNFCKPFCELVSKKYGLDIILDSRHPEAKFPEVLKNFGYPIISKEVSQIIQEAREGLKKGDGSYSYRLDKLKGIYQNKDGTLSQYNIPQYEFLLYAPFRISKECCHETKIAPAVKYEQEYDRIPLIATTCEESRLRRTKWLLYGCNAFGLKRPTSAPFSFWKNQDILRYLYRENLPLAEAYGKIVPQGPKYKMKGQMEWWELLQMFPDIPELTEELYNGDLDTTGCKRTGCLFCLYGITADPYRILRLQEIEPKRADYVLRGGQFDEDGMWIPSKEGLGYWFILDYLAEHGIVIPYKNPEKYRHL